MLALAACKQGGPVEPPAPSLTPAAYCASLPTGYCSRLVECGFLTPAEQEACASNTQFLCQQREQQTTADSAGFNVERAGACLEELAAKGACAELLHWTCLGKDVFPSTGQPGSACEGDADCTDGFCSRVGKPAFSCSQCAPYRRLGERCSASERCDPRGAYCAAAGTSDVKTCRPRRRAGVACESHEQCLDNVCNRGDLMGGVRECGYQPVGSRCAEEECEPGAVCLREQRPDGGYTQLGECRPRIAAGQRCAPQPQRDQGCADKMPCVSGVCLAPHSVPAGQNCFWDGYRDLDPYGQCVESAFCAILAGYNPPFCEPRRDAGAYCGGTTHNVACKEGLTCVLGPVNTLMGSCQHMREEGAPCEHSAQCLSGFCATPAGSSGAVCMRAPTTDAECGAGGPCVEHARCVPTYGQPGECRLRGPAGAACGRWSDCASGLCADAQGNEDPPAPGGFCWPGCL